MTEKDYCQDCGLTSCNCSNFSTKTPVPPVVSQQEKHVVHFEAFNDPKTGERLHRVVKQAEPLTRKEVLDISKRTLARAEQGRAECAEREAMAEADIEQAEPTKQIKLDLAKPILTITSTEKNKEWCAGHVAGVQDGKKIQLDYDLFEANRQCQALLDAQAEKHKAEMKELKEASEANT